MMKLRKIFGAAFAFCAMFAAAPMTTQTVGAEPYTYTNKEAGYSIMQPGSPLFDRLLARLPQTSR